MIITIDIPILIAKAKQVSGMRNEDLAHEMHISGPRLSEWAKLKREPTTDQIAYLADKANLPIIETVAALRPEWAKVWSRAKSQIASL